MVDPRRLLVFAEVVRSGSFSAAAGRLHLSQPSVSRHVAALERQCRLRLLDRTPHGLVLTDAGAAVLRTAQALHGALVTLDATVSAFADSQTGRVRIAAFPTAAASLATPTLVELRRSYPGLAVSLHEAGRDQALRELRDGDIDVAIVFDAGTTAETGRLRGLEQVELFTEPFLVALSLGHPLATRRTVALRQLRDEGWIVGTGSAEGSIERACREAGFTPRIVARVDDQPTIQALVAGGVGVTLIPELVSATVREGITLRPIRAEGLIRHVRAVTLDARPRAPAIIAFIDALTVTVNGRLARR